ncbi:hypothetical protein IKE84_02935 [Candidatus Saccharibacteria bacterium]|nr:hypothetical protein [Candidatus Saccharibacteria bacterium]
MEDFDAIDSKTISNSFINLRRILKERGWKNAKVIITNQSYIKVTRPDGKEIMIGGGTPPTTSYLAAALSDDKYATYVMLKSLPELKQPETILLRASDDIEIENEKLKALLKSHEKIVLKPFNGAHGHDVMVNINSLDEAMKALAKIREHGADLVIAQQMLKSDKPETRVICIDYKFVAAYSRIPAAVTGDGEHTVEELIDIENSTIRTAPYLSNLAYINKDAAISYLQEEHPNTLKSIPEKGKKVQVLAVCNTGQGGTMEDISGSFPEELKRLSEKVASKLELPLAGIDFFSDYVIEVNKAPALYHPVEGKGATYCIEKFVQYLETI